MIPITCALSSLVSPAHWFIAALIALAIVMPRFIPPAARWIGRSVRVVSRLRSLPPSRRATNRMLSAGPETPPSRPAFQTLLPWIVGLIVGVGAAVLSWILLRPR